LRSLITAYNDENAREQALRAGAVDYLVKPFEEADGGASSQVVKASRTPAARACGTFLQRQASKKP
jgi:CheY-like chemotaxis protein